MPINSASDSSEEPGHHVHYGHHEHFQQCSGLPHYKDLLRDFDKLEGKCCTSFSYCLCVKKSLQLIKSFLIS